MSVPYYILIKTRVLALEAYWLAEKEKLQADVFRKEGVPYSGTDKVF